MGLYCHKCDGFAFNASGICGACKKRYAEITARDKRILDNLLASYKRASLLVINGGDETSEPITGHLRLVE